MEKKAFGGCKIFVIEDKNAVRGLELLTNDFDLLGGPSENQEAMEVSSRGLLLLSTPSLMKNAF